MARQETNADTHKGFPTMRCSEPNCEYADSGSVQEGSQQRSYLGMLGHMRMHADAKGANKEGRTEEFTSAKESAV